MTAYRTPSRRWTTLVCAVALALTTVIAAPSASAEAAPGPDGTTSFTAAASCWEIKQHDLEATDGVYWLVTPALQAPERFYCDMTTDGGGWVLVGRGREDWRRAHHGRGTPEEVRETVDGPGAFGVRQLPAETIDGLLDGRRVDDLDDGVRLRRARDAAGDTWQEVRFSFADRDRWAWTFDAPHQVATYAFDGVSGSGGRTADFGDDDGFSRVFTDHRNQDGQGWLVGWAYGKSVTGQNNAQTHLWANQDGGGFARPFTQVFLRPQLRLADLEFPAIADSGAPAQELAPLLESFPLPGQWGVAGRGQNERNERFVQVQAFAEVNGRMFVGGNFRQVRHTSGGTEDQPFLAAFDVRSGEWLQDFRPRLNGQVRSLAALPNGLVVAGGEFSQANGAPAGGVVALDPTTGQTSSRWSLDIDNRLNCCDVSVRVLEVHRGWLYVGGNLTHLTGGPSSDEVYARMLGRVSVENGTPDRTWNPELSGTVVDLDLSDDRARAYAAGHFSHADDQTASKVAALSTDDASLVAPRWDPTWSNPTNYQQAIAEVGARVWSGGSEHSLFSFDRSDFTQTSGNIADPHGDFQSIASVGEVIYAGCHCAHWNFSQAFTWPEIGSGWTQADAIDSVAAWDADTGEVLPGFNPHFETTNGQGAWAITEDSLGNIWIGGDFTHAHRADDSAQPVGSFARFAQRDASAPTAPSDLHAVAEDADALTLGWSPSTDDSGAVAYEVIRDEVVVATTSETSLEVPAPKGTARYFVRAVDPTGNRSASTPALGAEQTGPGGPAGLVRISAPPGRIETAIAASRHRFDDSGADAVVLARADEYPDALAGSPLAASRGAPLLITSSNTLVPAVAQEIDRVLGGDGVVYLVGGGAALEGVVQQEVEALGYTTIRLGGVTRFETAGLIAQEIGDAAEVMITTGADFPDALTAGAAAGARGGVVLLTPGDARHQVVDDHLAASGAEVVWAIGGPAARAYPGAEPVFGATRDQTAVAVAERLFDDPRVFGAARLDDYPDALAGGAHLAAYGGPLLLVGTDQIPPSTQAWVDDASLTGGFVYGGAAAVSDGVFDQLAAHAFGD